MGAVSVIGGTLNFSIGVADTISSLTLSGGTVTGSDAVTVTGTTTWSSSSTLGGPGAY